MPFALSLSHADSSCDQVCGGFTPALASTSLRYRTGKDGWTYQPAVQTLPLYVSSDVLRECFSSEAGVESDTGFVAPAPAASRDQIPPPKDRESGPLFAAAAALNAGPSPFVVWRTVLIVTFGCFCS